LVVGLTPEELDALDNGGTPASLSDREHIVLVATRALVSERDLDDATGRSCETASGDTQ
jgi:hypothetical protein